MLFYTHLSPEYCSNFKYFRYLASEDLQRSVTYAFRVGFNTVSYIIKETCEVIWEFLKSKVIPQPNKKEWKNIAANYETIWNLPHCLGAIDGKHVVIDVIHRRFLYGFI
jgi:hypothetical protein